ncbi:MAG: FUSC family protein [Candidatus Nanopelagicales bacterium]
MATGNRPADDGRDILPDLRLADVMQQRPSSFRSPWQILRIAVAVTVAWVVGYWVSPSSFGIFAPLTTLLVISTSPWSTFGLSIQRILTTGIGVFATTLWVTVVDVTWWSVLIAMFAALLVASRLPVSLGARFQIPTAVLFVFALGQVTWEQAAWRVVDVAIGGAVGIVAIYLPPPKPHPERFEAKLQEYRDHILALIDSIARELRETHTDLDPTELHHFIPDSRALRRDAEAARDSLTDLAEMVAFNPRGRSARGVIGDDALRLRRLASIGVHVRGLAGAINRDYDRKGVAPALSKAALADRLEELAALGRLALGGPGMPVRAESAEIPRAAAELDSRLRDQADRMATEGTGEVLESVSLLGRIAYIGAQMEAFERVSDDADDRFDDD